MKSVILNVRISKDLKCALENQSIENEVSLSDMVREIIENHFNNTDNERNDFLNSNEFLLLITWLFEKRSCAYDGNSEAQLQEIKNILLNAIKSENIPNNLMAEFEKVLIDLVRYINTYHDVRNMFTFCKPNQTGSFDYDILIEYIFSNVFYEIINL